MISIEPAVAHSTVTTWKEFKSAWCGVLNFLMAGDCVPFSFEFPPLQRIVEELRQDAEVRIHPGKKGVTMDLSSIADDFRKMPIEEALRSQFSIAHYHLSPFDKPGSFLNGFREKVLDRWQEALRAQGFTWTRCYPIVFVSGKGCATNYHMDFSHVLAWQIYGTKNFCGLRDPERWAPHEVRMANRNDLPKPDEITDNDALCYAMQPGDALWNCLLTPHWVEASDEVAMSVNISHGGLRLHGELCPHEQELMKWMESHPERAIGLPSGVY